MTTRVELPVLPGVDPATLRALLNRAAGNWLVEHSYPPCVIVRHAGRCVEIKRANGTEFEPFAELAADLFIYCESFNIEGFSLFAVLKTAQQRAADDAAFIADDFDHWGAVDWRFRCFTQWDALAAPAPKRERAAKKPKRPRDGTNDLVVLKTIEGGEDDNYSEDTLFSMCAEHITAALPKYRKQYMRDALERLCAAGLITKADDDLYSLPSEAT